MTAAAPEIPAVIELLAQSGLCRACRHAEVLRSKRSAFLRCGRAAGDTRFPRYPGLPVLQCAGFETPAAAAKEPGNRAPIG